MDLTNNALNNIQGSDWLEDFPIAPSRDPIVLRDQVLEKLKQIIHPDLHQDIVSLGLIKQLEISYDDQKVSFSLHSLTSDLRNSEFFITMAKKVLKEIGWVANVSINLDHQSEQISKQALRPTPANLRTVSNILLVSSCKGGVGKSTVACNLAYMFACTGAKVGLIDADIYGPSLPYLLPISEQRVYFTETSRCNQRQRQPLIYETSTNCCGKSHSDDGLDSEAVAKENMQRALSTGSGGLIPIVYENVKLMSYGYLKSRDHAPLRGPVASTIVYQMITHTFWGELDYLIIDTPPGTGDIHLTLCESFLIAGAIIVTTPQQLSVSDCEKGIDFLKSLNIKILALVENMSYFVCNDCNSHHTIFTKNEQNLNTLADKWNIPFTCKLPLQSDFSTLEFERDNTTFKKFPFVLAFDATHPVWKELFLLTKQLIQEIAQASFLSEKLPFLSTTTKGLLQLTIFEKSTPTEISTAIQSKTIDVKPIEKISIVAKPWQIRVQCRCGECTDQVTGRSLLSLRKINPDISVKQIKYVGNSMIQIEWSDGHISCMNILLLKQIFQDIQLEKEIIKKEILPIPESTLCSIGGTTLDW